MKKLVGVLLILSLLAVSGMAYAAGASAGEVSLMETEAEQAFLDGDCIVQRELAFDENYDVTSVEGPLTEPYHKIGAQGMELYDTQSVFWAWNDYNGKSVWYPLSKNRAFLFRGKLDAGARLDFQLLCEEAIGRRAFVLISEEKVTIYGCDKNDPSKVASNTYNQFKPQNDWVTYLVTTDGTNYSVYGKRDGESAWSLIGTSPGFRPGGSCGALMENAAGKGKSYVSEVKLLAFTAAASKEQMSFLTGDYVVRRSVTFDEKFNGDAIHSPLGGTGLTIGEQGLEMLDTGSSPWRWNGFEGRSWTSLSKTDAVLFRAKMDAGGTIDFQANYIESGSRAFVRMQENKVELTGKTHVASKSFLPGNDWVTYLLTTDGVNYYLHGKRDEEKAWNLIGVSNGFRDYNTSGFLVENFSKTGKSYIDYVQQITVENVKSDQDEIFQKKDLWMEEEFTDYRISGQTDVALRSGAALDGVLTLIPTETSHAHYIQQNASIPVGGFLEFRYKAYQNTKFTFHNGKRELAMWVGASGGIVEGTGTIVNVANEYGLWHTYRVFANEDGSYHVYYKREGQDKWCTVLTNEMGVENTTKTTFEMRLEAGNDLTAQMENLILYGPEDNNPLILIDGVTAIPPMENVALSDPKNLRAIIAPEEDTDRSLILAGYNEEGTLTLMESRPVSKSAEKTELTIDTSGMKNVTCLRFFLWNGYDAIKPMGQVRTVAVEEGFRTNWEDDWTFTENAMVAGRKLELFSEGANYETSVTKKNCVPEYYDVSWKMQVHQYSSAENFQIKTGNGYRVMFYPTQYGCRYWEYNDENPNSYYTATIPYDIGFKEHTYRIIGHKDVCKIYIDGKFMAKGRPHKYSSKQNQVHIWNMGNAEANSHVSVWDLKIGSCTPEELNKEEEVVVLPFHFEFEEGEDLSAWTLNDSWVIEDGMLKSDNRDYLESHYAESFFPHGNAEDFTLTTRIRMPELGLSCGMQVFMPKFNFNLGMGGEYFSCNAISGNILSDEIKIEPDQWYDVKIETYNNLQNARLFLNDTMIGEMEPGHYSNIMKIRFTTTGVASECSSLWIDSIHYEPKYYQLELQGIEKGSVFEEGTPISLGTESKQEIADGSVIYRINGNVVAAGSGQEQSAVLENLPAGYYEITAESGDYISNTTPFSVVKPISATLVVENKGETMAVSLADGVGLERVAEVEYLVNGISATKVASAPYNAEVTGSTREGSMVEAICRDSNGVVLKRISKHIYPTDAAGRVSTHYSNEINYTVSGEEGEAEYILANGNHLLYLRHTKDSLVCMNEGEEMVVTYYDGQMVSGTEIVSGTENVDGLDEIIPGVGTFKIITDGPFADIYRNGQLAFSYIMPRSEKVERCVASDGLTITEESVTIPEERKNYLVLRDTAEKEGVHHLADLPYYYNLDFVADPIDEAQLVVNDGYYQMHMTLRDGKIYVRAADKRYENAEEVYLADMVKESGVYYRVEMGGGMARLLGNGKWLGTFRGAQTQGDNTAGINVTGGNGLAYLAVTDYTDIFYYEEDFAGDAKLDPVEYWQSRVIDPVVNTENKTMTLDARGQENVIVELNAYAGNVDMSADVTITEAKGGFWMMANHCISQSYTKLGYSFADQLYQIVDKVPTSETVTTEKGSMATETKLHLEMKVRERPEGKLVTLYVNGEPVITKDASFNHRGRVGFILSDCVATIENVYYRGDTKPVPALTDSPILGSTTNDMIETEEEIIITSGGGGHVTSDGGKTWGKYVPKGDISENMVQLKDSNELLSFKRFADGVSEDGHTCYNYRCSVSRDYGQTWEVLVNKVMPVSLPGRLSMQNRLTQGHSGRVYFVTSETNNEAYGAFAIWYSDDAGRSWKESETYLDGEVEGYCIQEGVVVETKSNTRCYFRNDKGMLMYFDSKDRGQTWDKVPKPLPFVGTMTCFNVEVDPEDGAVYIAWGYDNPNLAKAAQTPRTRWAVAKSTDDGENWTWLGTAHENNHISSNMMNLCINVSKDYLIMHCFSDDLFDTSQWHCRLVVMEKDKQTPTMRFERVHESDFAILDKMTSVTVEDKKNRTMAVHSANGSVLLNNERVENAVEGSKLALGCGAIFVGSVMTEDGAGGWNLTCGTSVVNFAASEVTMIGDKPYVELSVFADRFHLYTTERDGTVLVSTHKTFTTRQGNSFCYALDLFAEKA